MHELRGLFSYSLEMYLTKDFIFMDTYFLVKIKDKEVN